MQFLKKNYEKVLLIAVVVAALAVVACLPFMVSNEKQQLADQESSLTNRAPKLLPPLDLHPYQALLARAQTNTELDMTNKLFNPVRWQLNRSNQLFANPAGREIELLEVTKLSPLYFVVSLVTVNPSGGTDMPTHYGIGLEHDGALLSKDRLRKTTFATLGVATNGFTVLSVEGAQDDPSSVSVQLSEPDQTVTITKDHPFKSQEGYTIDMRYPPEGRTFANRRIGDVVSFGGESYKIIDIKDSEVVLLQQSNQKPWIKKFTLTNASSTAPPS